MAPSMLSTSQLLLLFDNPSNSKALAFASPARAAAKSSGWFDDAGSGVEFETHVDQMVSAQRSCDEVVRPLLDREGVSKDGSLLPPLFVIPSPAATRR